jgi:putative ABC transport system ATP-binding protein
MTTTHDRLPSVMPEVVRIRGLVKTRAQGGVAFELRVPALEVNPGELVALVGESGCGKSTLLDLLALVLRPDVADTFLLRQDQADPPIDIQALWQRRDEEGLARLRRDRLGYVLQSGGLLSFLSVGGNIGLPRRLKDGRAGDLMPLADRMGMASLLRQKPRFLSGGQRQRAAILRALAHRPAIILADEPTAAVDSTRACAIVADFRSLARQEGCAIVMVSHDLRLVDAFADRSYGYRLEAVTPSLTRSICEPRHAGP